MFLNSYELGMYVLIRIDMVLGKQFKKLKTTLINDKTSNNILLKVTILYNKQNHTCLLKLKKENTNTVNNLNKEKVDKYVESLCLLIEEKLNIIDLI
jgi:hypothetical protein